MKKNDSLRSGGGGMNQNLIGSTTNKKNYVVFLMAVRKNIASQSP